MTTKEIFNPKYMALSLILFSAAQFLPNRERPLAVAVLYGVLVTAGIILHLFANRVKEQSRWGARLLDTAYLVLLVVYSSGLYG